MTTSTIGLFVYIFFSLGNIWGIFFYMGKWGKKFFRGKNESCVLVGVFGCWERGREREEGDSRAEVTFCLFALWCDFDPVLAARYSPLSLLHASHPQTNYTKIMHKLIGQWMPLKSRKTLPLKSHFFFAWKNWLLECIKKLLPKKLARNPIYFWKASLRIERRVLY